MSQTIPSASPKLVICFGVSGCGKSTLANHLAEKFQLELVEADDFHPEVNKAHMAAGKPLTDAMREPWIVALCEHIKEQAALGKNCVMANSGLRRAHRQRFRELGLGTLLLHMDGPRDLIFERMQSRADHFMPASLLDSQFAALESPEGESDVMKVDIAQDIPAILKDAEVIVDGFLKGA